MDYIFLDGARLTKEHEAQQYLAEKLAAPRHYGHNLDALYDTATSFTRALTIILYGSTDSPYARRVLCVLRDAAAENPNLCIRLWGA